MLITLIIFVFILGLIIGSFLNVVIYRLPRGESIVFPGSHCIGCGTSLKPYDLLPVLSYLWLKGKCRYCGEKISIRYPLVEILTGVLYIFILLKWGLSIITIAGFVLAGILITAALTDVDTGIIPDSLTYPGMIVGIILAYFTIGIKAALIGGLSFGAVLFIIALISRGGMGGGDIKLAAVIGTFTGWQGSLMTLFLASILGGVWAITLLLQGKANRKTAIKFGPFLALAGFLAWNWGTEIFDFYLKLIY